VISLRSTVSVTHPQHQRRAAVIDDRFVAMGSERGHSASLYQISLKETDRRQAGKQFFFEKKNQKTF
jgi:hypothetical protein